MNDGRLHLKSFAAGDTIRVFQAEKTQGSKKIDKTYSLHNYKKYESCIDYYNDEDIKYHYLMKDKTQVKLNSYFTDDFIDFLQNSINRDVEAEAKNQQKNSDEYYSNLFIDCNNSIKILQRGKKIYFLADKKYIENSEYGSYDITQFNNQSEVNDALKKYISDAYDDYYEMSHNVDNKSIPVYKLDESALHDLYIIRLYNRNFIDSLINENQYLSAHKNEILFNSEKFELDSTDYDSILIDNLLYALYDELLNVYKDEKTLKERLSELSYGIFEKVFSQIPKDSFYRILIPIGNIRKIVNENKEKYSNAVSQYMYSMQLNELNDDISTNYFSLKNLKNPELYQDYSLCDINDFKSVKSSNYNLSYNIISKIFKAYNVIVVNQLLQYVNEFDLRNVSSEFINGNEDILRKMNIDRAGTIMNELADIFSRKYPNFNKASIDEFFASDSKSSKKQTISMFVTYMRDNFGIDITIDKFFFPLRMFKEKLIELFSQFNDEMNSILVSLKGIAGTTDSISKISNAFKEIEDLIIKKIEKEVSNIGDEIDCKKYFINQYLKSIDFKDFSFVSNQIYDGNLKFHIDEDMPAELIVIDGEIPSSILKILNDDERDILMKKIDYSRAYQVFDVKKLWLELGKNYYYVESSYFVEVPYEVRDGETFSNKEKIVNEIRLPKEIDNFKYINYSDASLMKFLNNIIKCTINSSKEYVENDIARKLIEDGIFKAGIYYDNAKDLFALIKSVDEAAYSRALADDSDYENMSASYAPLRFTGKIDDYLSTYRDLYEKENTFEVSGVLYGLRRYDDAFKNSKNDICIEYNYDTSFDYNFLKSIGFTVIDLTNVQKISEFIEDGYENDVDDMLNDLLTSNKNNAYMFSEFALHSFIQTISDSSIHHITTSNTNRLNAQLNARLYSPSTLDTLFNRLETEDKISVLFKNNETINSLSFFKLENNCILMCNENKNTELSSYLEMLKKMKNVKFVDVIKGQHYYKETELHKSNVFSINIKNSGLKYDLYSYDEMKKILEKDYKLTGEITEANLDIAGFGKIDVSKNISKISLPIDSSSSDYLKNYKFFKYENEELERPNEMNDDEYETYKKDYKKEQCDLMELKVYLRSLFEDAVRKSIHRYIPANTTLWKIEYDK